MRHRLSVVLAMTGDEAEDKAHYEYHGIEAVSGVQRGGGPLAATIGPVTTKVSMVPMVPQVRIKFTSFGEATRVCCEPSVMIEV